MIISPYLYYQHITTNHLFIVSISLIGLLGSIFPITIGLSKATGTAIVKHKIAAFQSSVQSL